MDQRDLHYEYSKLKDAIAEIRYPNRYPYDYEEQKSRINGKIKYEVAKKPHPIEKYDKLINRICGDTSNFGMMKLLQQSILGMVN